MKIQWQNWPQSIISDKEQAVYELIQPKSRVFHVCTDLLNIVIFYIKTERVRLIFFVCRSPDRPSFEQKFPDSDRFFL